MTDQIRVRLNRMTGLIVIPMGTLGVVVSLVTGSPLTAVAAGLLVVLGVLYCFGTVAVVLPHEVQVRNPVQITTKRVAIDGLADLDLDGTRLRRRTDRKQITTLAGLTTNADDVARLRVAIHAAQAAPTR